MWLDGGELRHLFEWMKAGGKLLQQEREQEQRRIETRKLEQEKRISQIKSAAGGTYQQDSDFGLFSGALKDSDPDFLSIIIKAFRFFKK